MHYPIITLTVEHMQYQIRQAISPYEQELEEGIKQAVARAVKEFSPQEEIERLVRKTLHEQIQYKVNNEIQIALLQQSDPPLLHLIRDEVARQLKEER